MVDTTDKEVRYDILIEAKAAIKGLQALSSETEGTAKKIENLANLAVQLGNKMGTSWQTALGALKAVKAELQGAPKAAIFGQGNDLIEQGAEAYLKATEGAGSFSKKQEEVAKSTKKVQNSVEGANKSLFSFKNLLKTGLTALALRALFSALTAIQKVIKDSIDLVRNLEISMSKLSTAEEALSEAGIVVQMEDLLTIVSDIATKFKAFSDADIKQAVSNAALLTKEFGFTVEQIRQATEAGAALALRTPGESIEGATEKLLSGLTSGKFVALRNMGVGIDAVSVQTRALADTGKKLVSQLTTQDKAAATLAIVYEGLADEIENVDEKLDTLDGRMRQTDAASENLKVTFGSLFAPFIMSLAPFLNAINDALTMIKVFVVGGLSAVASFGTVWTAVMTGNIKSLDDFKNALALAKEETLGDLVNEFFPDGIPDEAPAFLDDFFSHLEQFEDTPTGEVKELVLTLEDLEDVDLDDLADDLAKLNMRIDELNATFERTEGRKHEDYLTKKARAEEDYRNKVIDINQDAATSRAEANRSYREKELDGEAKYQNALRKLREQFLFSLEDALRERDARQVLRLTRKFEMDKNNLTNDYATRKAEEARQHQQDLADINRRTQERLAEAAREHKIKMARMAEDEALRARRAKADHAREIAELQAQINRRLEEEARAIAEELELREEGARAIFDVLNSYYGQGGAFEGLFSYAAKAQVAQYEAMLARIMAIQAQVAAVSNSFSKDANLPSGYAPGQGGGSSLFSKDSNLPSGYLPSIGAQADGGTYFANKPTQAIFGEAGGEFATFTPANKVQSREGSEMSGGELHVILDLNPDLEARIVDSSLRGVSTTIEVIRREQ